MRNLTRLQTLPTILLLLVLPLVIRPSIAQNIPNPDTTALPPRSVPESLPPRPVPDWVRTHFRVGHLPGSLPMAEAFVKAGYNVVTLNTLGRWDIVGPSASLYPPEHIKEAEDYMRTHAERCHQAGAKAVFYIGPVQVPVGNPAFVKAHPDWLRIRPDGKPDSVPNFANIRSGYADWLLEQLAYVTHVQGRRLLVRRLRPAPPAHLRRCHQTSLPRVLRRQRGPPSTRLRPRRPNVLRHRPQPHRSRLHDVA